MLGLLTATQTYCGLDLDFTRMSVWPDTRNSLLQRLADPSDASAWEEFESAYQPAIYRYVRGRGLQPSDAMDVVQEVMFAIHRRAAKWEPGVHRGSFRAWLIETARRTTLYHLRLRNRSGQGCDRDFEALVDSDHESSAQLQRQDEQRWSFYCAAALIETEVNPLHWRAFWMTAVEGRSAEEVGAELNMKVGTVYSIRCRIQSKIRSAIENELDQSMGEQGDDHAL